MYMYPGGKVRAISRGDLARGDIACDPAHSRQIPWFRVRLRESAKRRDYARSRVHIINARVSHLGSKAPRQVLNTSIHDYLLRFLELQQESHAFSIKGHRAQGDRSREGVARRER